MKADESVESVLADTVERWEPMLTPNPKTGRDDFDGMMTCPDGEYVRFEDYQAFALAHAREAQDAGRYRWLRNNCTAGRMAAFHVSPYFALNCDEPGEEWDAAIDAALQAEQARQQGEAHEA